VSRVHRVRFLAVAVLAVAAVLVVMSRRIGHGDLGGGRPARRAAGDRAAAAAGAGAPGVPDLSFYDTLGVTPGGGDGDGPSPSGPRLPAGAGEAVPTGGYVIQVLATHDRDQAVRVRDQVAALGLPARLIEGEVEGKAIYRIRAGSYRERRTAVAWAEKIEARIGLTPWVLQEER
jgi:hypothetical protein